MITHNDGANLTVIVLANVLVGSGFVLNHDTAVDQVGYQFMAFDEPLPPLPTDCTPLSIDVGEVLTAITLDAAGDSFCFADDAGVRTNVVLQNFEFGDWIEVTGASASDYNFASDFDDNNDLVITYSNPVTGATNVILVDDLLPDTGSGSDFANVVATLGYNFMTSA